jgi:hypothetical protein
LSQTARWAARRKLANMVEGVEIVRGELGLMELVRQELGL